MEKEFNFVVTEKEANLILQAMGELPAKVSFNLIIKLQNQVAQSIIKETPEKVSPLIEKIKG